MVDVPPTATVEGFALRVTVPDAPATNVTVVEALKLVTAAVTVAVPRLVGAVSWTVAIPLMSVVAVLADSVPAVVLNATTRPAGDPDATVTVARMAAVLTPSAGILDGAATTVIPVTGAATISTETLPVMPLVVRAWRVSVPSAVPV